jgi:hypothetical protein
MVKSVPGQTGVLDVYMKNGARLTPIIRHVIIDVACLALSTLEC